MTLDLSEGIVDLNKKVMYNGDSAGHVLAHYLMDISTKDPLRVFKISMHLLDDVEFEIDDEDYNLLYAIVEKGSMSNMLKVRILNQLQKCKDGD